MHMDISPILLFWIAHFLLPFAEGSALPDGQIQLYDDYEMVVTVERHPDGFRILPPPDESFPDDEPLEILIDPEGTVHFGTETFELSDYFEETANASSLEGFLEMYCGQTISTQACGVDLREDEATLEFWGPRTRLHLVWGEEGIPPSRSCELRFLYFDALDAASALDVPNVLDDPDDLPGTLQFSHGSIGPSHEVAPGIMARAWRLNLAAGSSIAARLEGDFPGIMDVVFVSPDGCVLDDAFAADGRVIESSFTANQPGEHLVVMVGDMGESATPFSMEIGDPAVFDMAMEDPFADDPFSGEEWDDEFWGSGRTLPEGLTAEGRSVSVGEQVEGRLDPEAATFVLEDGQALQAWELVLEADQEVTIDLRSNEVDAYLFLTGESVYVPLEDDDGGDGLDSRIVYWSLEGGRYLVVASSFGVESGGYTLEVTEGADQTLWDEGDWDDASWGFGRILPEALTAEGRSVSVGGQVEGRLDPEAATFLLEDGQALEAWELVLEADQEVIIDLRSDEVDAYLFLSGGSLDEAIYDDDGGDGLDSRIVYRSLEGGRYLAVASSFGVETGRYSLEVREIR